MAKLEEELREEIYKTEKLLKNVNKELKKVDKCHEKVKVFFKGNSMQAYINESDGDKKFRKYLHVSEQNKVINMVKHEYYSELKSTLEKRIRILNTSLGGIINTDIRLVYDKLGRGKKNLVTPVEISDAEYRKIWEECDYKGKGFDEDAPEIYTEKGERVRSKSEKIIADKLYMENIAYRYEYPLDIPYIGVYYPDFTVLDERYRRNIIIEHFGLMDNEEYVNNALSKMNMYANEGYILGDSFFCTMETSSRPLDSRMLDGIINIIKNT